MDELPFIIRVDSNMAIADIQQQDNWTEVIEPRSNILDLRLKDVWRYRDLMMLFVKRDFVATYKQTILGPLWFILQPIFTTLTYMLVFGEIAQLSTDGTPKALFYLSGITLWNYFSESLNRTATTLKDNAPIFGKVYFPRLVMPLSIVISNLIKLGIQFALFLCFWGFFLLTTDKVQPNSTILLLPVLVIIMGGLGLGFGLMITALTTKYRDMVFMLSFGIQLLMFATPIIYPLSTASKHWWLQWIIQANPMTPIIETFRYAFMGAGNFSWMSLGYSAIVMIAVMLIGTVVFNRVERSFMDTV